MSILKPLSVAMLAATLAACAAPMSASKPEPLNNEDWYQVRSETQVILFDDLQVFKDYLASGQAPSMRTLEDKDANGLEVVLALRAEDQGKPLDKIAAYRFFKVAQVPAHPFYGEVRQDGSIYVFKRYGDMQDMVKLGEPIFRYTDIGSGPNGQTVTYGELARQLAEKQGRPRMSAQAVGGAVGHNKISIIIPCHRVVGTGGSLTGYAGGIDRKVKLLALEQADMTRFFVPKTGTAL